MTELKRCPFCGETDKVNIEWINPNGEEPCDIGELFLLATCGRCGLNMQQDYIKWEDRPIEDELNARIAQLTAERDEWRKDAERFAEHYGGFDEGGNYCVFCGEYTEQDGITINHDNDCPITLHRELVAKYGTENPVSDADITG